MTENEWVAAVKGRTATCYLKPARKKGAGPRGFELGYCRVGEDGAVENKLVLSEGASHVHADYLSPGDPARAMPLNMGVTADGYVRLWGNESCALVWQPNPTSSAELTLLENRI